MWEEKGQGEGCSSDSVSEKVLSVSFQHHCAFGSSLFQKETMVMPLGNPEFRVTHVNTDVNWHLKHTLRGGSSAQSFSPPRDCKGTWETTW